jgi:hypothetical protein
MNGLGIALLLLLLITPGLANAQQLDLGDPNLKPGVHAASPRPAVRQPVTRTLPPSHQASSGSAYYAGAGQPLSATVSKVRYLPPEMFGQWSLAGQLLKTDDASTYSPTMSEIWLLERQGDQLIISNPSTGGQASIAVEKVEGKTAFLTRELWADKNHTIQENFTIRVTGDTLDGQSLHRVRTIKNGQIINETFGLYQIEAKRIGQAQFRAESPEPDIQIEEPRRQ